MTRPIELARIRVRLELTKKLDRARRDHRGRVEAERTPFDEWREPARTTMPGGVFEPGYAEGRVGLVGANR